MHHILYQKNIFLQMEKIYNGKILRRVVFILTYTSSCIKMFSFTLNSLTRTHIRVYMIFKFLLLPGIIYNYNLYGVIIYQKICFTFF